MSYNKNVEIMKGIKMDLKVYNENKDEMVAVANVTPVTYMNDGYYHASDNGNEELFVNEDGTLLLDKNGQAKWIVEDIGEDDCIYQIKGVA